MLKDYLIKFEAFFFLIVDIKCLPCRLHFLRENVLKKHYFNHYFINEEDAHFKDLFLSDTVDKTYRICRSTFNTARSKKEHMFLFHYGTRQQEGGRGPGTSNLPISVLRRGPITYYSNNFSQHRNFYDFFSTGVVESCLNSVYQGYRLDKETKIQRYVEIVN